MKALVVDKFPKAGLERMKQLGLGVDYEPDNGAKLTSLLADHDVLVVRSSKVSGDAIRAAKHLQLIVRAGAGVNTIDVKTASEFGVFVTNCPGKNAIAVAELAMGLLIGLDRRIPQAHAELKQGQWNKKEYSKADGLYGKTLGVVGLGQIGEEVVRRALSFGMHVVAWSRSLTPARAKELGVEMMSTPLALAERSDAVSLHLAYTAETKGLVGAEFLSRLRERALLVNTSRDGIVDEAALLEAMRSRGLRYATDVFDGEPSGGTANFESPVARDPQVVATPHIGASTEQAQSAVADETVRIIETFVKTGQALNCVNLSKQSPAHWQLNVRHLDRVGVLAHVLGSLREASINVEEVENVIFEGAQAACARIRLGTEPSAQLVASINAYEHVLHARVVPL
jgi:D-3-phosphoglycerate dehydrogenase / 2-oxoglutarate reductase